MTSIRTYPVESSSIGNNKLLLQTISMKFTLNVGFQRRETRQNGTITILGLIAILSRRNGVVIIKVANY